MKRARSHDNELKEMLRNPNKEANYLRVASEDPDKRVFLLALKDVIEARSGMSKIARLAKVDRAHLYVMLSESGNPEWISIHRILDALGLRLTITPKKEKLAA